MAIHERFQSRHVADAEATSQPRVGFAYRLNDNTAIRFGYARYSVPTEFNFAATPSGVTGYESLSFLEPPYNGINSIQNTAPLLNGVPQATL